MQPEFVKLAMDADEVQRFNGLAAGTALVHGQRLARQPFSDPLSYRTVFGFPLFEAGTDLDSLYAVAFGNPLKAQGCLERFLRSLDDWYHFDGAKIAPVSLPVDQTRLAELILNLEQLSPSTATLVGTQIDAIATSPPRGVSTRVHGDLHLENILIPRTATGAHLVDFANASSAGSPCLDVARLECDLIYRLLPFDLQPEEVGQFESNLWAGRWDQIGVYGAGALVASLRLGSEVFATENSLICLLVGRIVNALRMLARSWTQVIPYRLTNRRKGIVASLRVLANILRSVLGGSKIHLTVPPRQVAQELGFDAIRSATYLFRSRQYLECVTFARAVGPAATRSKGAVCLLGAVAGQSIGLHNDAAGLAADAPPARTSLDRGLRKLYAALQIARNPEPRRLNRSVKYFDQAQDWFNEIPDKTLAAISADQLARTYQRLGMLDSAKVAFTDSIRLKKEIPDKVGLAVSLGGLGLLHMATYDHTDARQNLESDLDIVRELHDLKSEAKLLNWIGQLDLIVDFAVLKAVESFTQSLRVVGAIADEAYNPALDRAFARLGLGFAYCALDSPRHALESETLARRDLATLNRRSSALPSAICEILSAQIIFLEGNFMSAEIRLTGGLQYLRDQGFRSEACDYTIRTGRFLIRHGEPQMAARLARASRSIAHDLHTPRLYTIIDQLANPK